MLYRSGITSRSCYRFVKDTRHAHLHDFPPICADSQSLTRLTHPFTTHFRDSFSTIPRPISRPPHTLRRRQSCRPIQNAHFEFDFTVCRAARNHTAVTCPIRTLALCDRRADLKREFVSPRTPATTIALVSPLHRSTISRPSAGSRPRRNEERALTTWGPQYSADESRRKSIAFPGVAASLLALRTTQLAHQAPASWRLHGCERSLNGPQRTGDPNPPEVFPKIDLDFGPMSCAHCARVEFL